MLQSARKNRLRDSQERSPTSLLFSGSLSGAKERKSCRPRRLLKNAYLEFWMQKSALIQPRTSPLKFWGKAGPVQDTPLQSYERTQNPSINFAGFLLVPKLETMCHLSTPTQRLRGGVGPPGRALPELAQDRVDEPCGGAGGVLCADAWWRDAVSFRAGYLR